MGFGFLFLCFFHCMLCLKNWLCIQSSKKNDYELTFVPGIFILILTSLGIFYFIMLHHDCLIASFKDLFHLQEKSPYLTTHKCVLPPSHRLVSCHFIAC